MHLSLDDIIHIYEQSRPWYGVLADNNVEPQSVLGLKDCLENIDLVLLDSYGVLCRGNRVISEALVAIAYLRENNIPFCVVSNDTMSGTRTVESKYKKLGYDFSKDEVVTSLDVIEDYLEKQGNLSSYAATGLLNNILKEKFPQIQDLNADGGVIREGVDTLMFHVGKGWTDKMQLACIKSSTNIKNIIISNPDVGAPDGDDFVATPGYYAHDFYQKTVFQKAPLLLGKPAKYIFEKALKQAHYTGKNGHVLMVGDSLHTDILGGQGMGFKTLLLESGIFRKGGLQKNMQKTSIIPTYRAPTL